MKVLLRLTDLSPGGQILGKTSVSLGVETDDLLDHDTTGTMAADSRLGGLAAWKEVEL